MNRTLDVPEPTLDWLQDPEVFAVNRLPAHSDHCWTVGGVDTTRSLDGAWRFSYVPSIAERPRDFWRTDANLSTFDCIHVPAHIELEGFGQIQYVNTQYPWDGLSNLRPPAIDPARTAVGCYVRDFELDPAWEDMRVCFVPRGRARVLPLVQRRLRGLCRGQLYAVGL